MQFVTYTGIVISTCSKILFTPSTAKHTLDPQSISDVGYDIDKLCMSNNAVLL